MAYDQELADRIPAEAEATLAREPYVDRFEIRGGAMAGWRT